MPDIAIEIMEAEAASEHSAWRACLEVGEESLRKGHSRASRIEDLPQEQQNTIIQRMNDAKIPQSLRGSNNDEYLYELQAVIMHKGSGMGSGHYFGYIRDSLCEGTWDAGIEGYLEGLDVDIIGTFDGSKGKGNHRQGQGGRAETAYGEAWAIPDEVTQHMNATTTSDEGQSLHSSNSYPVDESAASYLRKGKWEMGWISIQSLRSLRLVVWCTCFNGAP